MVRWCSKQSGGHRLRLIVKSVDGPWLVSDQSAGGSEDWRELEFRPLSLSWRLLDIDEGKVMGETPPASLTKIDAIGFTDLMAGGGSNACLRAGLDRGLGRRSLPGTAKNCRSRRPEGISCLTA